jgi:hypothetical protein
MVAPESRRFGKADTRPKIKLSSPDPSPSKSKTTRRTHTTRTTRRTAEDGEGGEKAAIVAAAKEETRAKNQMVLIGSIGGGVFVLILIIAVAASSSGSAREVERRPVKKAAAEPPPPPPPPKKSYNYVRNTGAIVFVCGGSEKHPDREVVLAGCPKCPTRNNFAWDETASGYRCSSCKNVYENADIKCDQCGRTPRVTHLKKAASAQ